MESNKIEDLLLKMIEDIAYIKSKLESLDDQNLGSRIDAIEAQNKEHDHTIKSLENRCNAMEQFTRSNMVESKKQMTSIYVSMGMAVFSCILSILSKVLF